MKLGLSKLELLLIISIIGAIIYTTIDREDRVRSATASYRGCSLYLNGEYINSFQAINEEVCKKKMDEAVEKISKK